jgi:dTDP-4-dehydrorhamnose 3,5-epimerase
VVWQETALAGVWLILPERRVDERGAFARTWCDAEAAEHGICVRWVQANVSSNIAAGTLRGLHFQAATHPEPKLVRCSRGAIFDVAVDLRADSGTFGRHASATLSAAYGEALFIPAGFAHGFQTLTDDAEVSYLMGGMYHAAASRGVRWDDPELGVAWPAAERRTISDRDLAFPTFSQWREAA